MLIPGRGPRLNIRRLVESIHQLSEGRGATKFISDCAGSLIVYISFLFLVALIVSLGVVDISDAYLVKRELISAGENLLSQGVQQIDLSRYYQNGITPSSRRVPLDCARAVDSIYASVSEIVIRGNHPHIDLLRCEEDSLELLLSVQIRPLVVIPEISSFSNSHEVISAHLQEAAIVQ